MANLRAGLIGLGMMGRHHARVLRSLDGVELVAVLDHGGDQYSAAGDLSVLTDIERLLTERLDYCVVAVPTSFHEEIGVRLAAAGVHALIEKPLAEDVPSAMRIAAAFREAGLIGAVGHIERYNPALQQARARLEAGELGDVYQIATRRQGPFPTRIVDVGVVQDLGSHDIDLTAWVTQREYVSVSARTAHQSGGQHEDLVAVLAQLSDGTVANHLVNWLSPLKERVTIITGERGTFVADTLAADLTFYANGENPQVSWDAIANFRGVSEGDVIRYAIAKPEPLRVEHESFRDAVLGKSHNIVTLDEGVNTVRVAAACLESAETKTTVHLT